MTAPSLFRCLFGTPRPDRRPRLARRRPLLEPLVARGNQSGGLLDTTLNGTEILPSSMTHRGLMAGREAADNFAIQPDGKIVSVGYVATNGASARA